ncbi:MAG: DUF3604 domain-containing protein [Deltaproteobacteria bacterium]|nr:MAG: DUF3604 domain-containing protein [Deltaproteobacteria bacterium]
MLPLRDADEVTATRLVPGRSDLWLAVSRAQLDREGVWAARWDGRRWSEPAPVELGAWAFRPAVARVGGGVAVAAAVPGGIAGALLPDGPRFSIATTAPAQRVALAGDGDGGAWLAWDEVGPHRARVRVARVDGGGRVVPVPGAGVDGRSPALAATHDGAWLAWIGGGVTGAGRARAARLPGGAAVEVDAIDAPQEAPAIAVDGRGRAWVAWHANVPGDREPDIVRWVRVAAVDAAGAVTAYHPPAELAGAREVAGPDQGWEFPAIAVAGDDVWVAARSSHGWHAARLRAGRWSARVSLSTDDWGGRGRTVALATDGERVIAVRREPDGVAACELTDAPPAAPVSPPRVPPGPEPAKIGDTLFGDLHQHTACSDGCGTPEALYLWARDRRRLDFAAVTDHDRFCRRAIGPATWAYLRDVADAFDEPGRFAAVCGYEFTGPRHPGPGHKCVYFEDRGPDRLPDKDVGAIAAAVRAHNGIAVPHHVGWTGADLAHHDPTLQPVWEVFSVHGCYEQHDHACAFPPRADVVLPGQFVKDALDAGHRFGFIASTDSHGLLWHHGVARKRDPFACGLAALPGAEPTRASILAALRARRCYATTGARIRLRVDLDGAPMGAELPADTEGALSVEVDGTAALAEVTLVQAGGEVALPRLDGARCRARVRIACGPGRQWDYVYVRVRQVDGEMAWSSPIWLG